MLSRRDRLAAGIAVPILVFLAVGAAVLATERSACPDAASFDCIAQFDGVEYLAIAERGYWYVPGEQSPIVWFPLYPLTIRGLDALVGDPLVAAVGVSLVAGLVALIGCWRWFVVLGLSPRARLLAVAVVALYPYAFYLYGVPYGSSLLLALLVGAFLLVERGSPVLAGLVGAAATASHPEALAVVPALVLVALERDGALRFDADRSEWRARWNVPSGIDRSAVRARAFGPLLSLAGVGAYSAYLWHRWGDPLAFSTNQSTYRPGDVPITKLAFIDRMLDPFPNPVLSATLLAQVLLALAVLWMVPAVAHRFGAGYGLYVALLVAMPAISSADYMGTGRYLLGAFPVAAVVGERFVDRPRLAAGWLAASGVALLVLAGLYARGRYLS